MNEFIYQIGRKEEDDKINIDIYSINDKKEIKLAKKALNYQILMKKADFETLNIKSDKILLADKPYFDKNGDEIAKIEVKSKELYDYIHNQAKELEIIKFEADLKSESRYLIDNKVEIINGQYIAPKYLSIDIETVGKVEEQEIVLISSYSPDSKDTQKVYVNSQNMSKKNIEQVKKTKFKDFECVILDTEKEMLEKFQEDVFKFKPQILIGWNVIDFDFKVIKDKMESHGIEFKLSEFEGDTRLRINRDFFRSSTLTAPGVIVFDAIDLLKMNFIVFEDYKLDTVARNVLKDSKIKLENDENAPDSIENKIDVINNMFKNDPVSLIEYNYKDSYLTSAIVEELNLIELMVKRSIITNTPLERVKSPIATLDIMYLRELHEQNKIAMSNFNFNDSTPIEGAFVLDPKQGFYKDIFVLDFKSLYPSIIMTFNIDPFTYDLEKGDIEAPNGVKFLRKKGILPEIILTLYKERDIAKNNKDKIMSNALKLTMNSFYGSIASPKSRFYNKDVGEAITSFGREIIQVADKYLETKGLTPIYNDTDSVFIKSDKEFKSFEEKKKFGEEIERDLNKYFDDWTKKNYNVESYLKLEFEKIFSNFFIASKKRYVGYDEITKDTMFVGMEAIRGDWTELAQNFQRALVDMIFKSSKEEDIKKFIIDYTVKLKEGKFNDQLIYKKKITKPLSEYTKTTPPHVRAAREVEGFTGRMVQYVMTKNGPKHVKIAGDEPEYDYDHYVDKQLKGVSDDLLKNLKLDFEEILFSKKQKGLNSFF